MYDEDGAWGKPMDRGADSGVTLLLDSPTIARSPHPSMRLNCDMVEALGLSSKLLVPIDRGTRCSRGSHGNKAISVIGMSIKS